MRTPAVGTATAASSIHSVVVTVGRISPVISIVRWRSGARRPWTLPVAIVLPALVLLAPLFRAALDRPPEPVQADLSGRIYERASSVPHAPDLVATHPERTTREFFRRAPRELWATTGARSGAGYAFDVDPDGSYSFYDRVMREVMWPTVKALAAEGTPYIGFLYAGLMIAADGAPSVIEFNCRFGDPETQPLLARMRSDLTVLCEAALDGRLAGAGIEWDPRAAVGVVLAAHGYPDHGGRFS